MAIRLLVLDIEGVLVLPGGSEHAWPLEALLQIRRRLRASPAAAILCSGRQEPYGEAMVQALDLYRPLPPAEQAAIRHRSGREIHSWPSILENGAYFYDPVAKRPFPHPALTPTFTRELRRLRAEVLDPLMDETGAQIEPGKEFCISINPPALGPGRAERHATGTFRPVVERAIAGWEGLVEVNHSASAIDLTPIGINKATAIRLLMAWTGLNPEEVLGIGDSSGDAEWLGVVGWSVAPANGREALPGLRYYAAGSVTDGLVEVLERLERHGYAGV